MPGVLPRRFGSVDVHALWTIQLDHGLAGNVGQADGKHGLVLAIDTGAVREIAGLVFLYHLSNTPEKQNVTTHSKIGGSKGE